jgi:CRISPR/Cas system CSM-associated protein Csm2 small subunit
MPGTATARGLRIVTRPGHPDFLDLPWGQPLGDWEVDRVVEVLRGVHRHVVRFVDYGGAIYSLKELPDGLAEREYRLLRRMADEALPAVEAVGTVERADLDDVLITRYLDYSLPYRALFTHLREGEDVPEVLGSLLDALAVLLVRLHRAGFFWGDCSLSNTLFRRDAGALAAYLVDVETGEWHPTLSSGQRETDLAVTVDNFVGGLLDVQAELGLPPEPDPVETAEDLQVRYIRLWNELTTPVVVGPGDRHLIEGRVRRLNELGFDVEEIELVPDGDGDRLVLRAAVVESGHHQRRLFSLTGLRAQENQARSLLNDMANFKVSLEQSTGRPISEIVAAHRWMIEVFEPTVTAIPDELRQKLEPAEVFHEVIEHKWFLSEAVGRDVGIEEAVASYMASILPAAPDERLLLTDDAEDAYIGFG